MKYKLSTKEYWPVELYIETEKYVFTFWVNRTIKRTESNIEEYEV